MQKPCSRKRKRKEVNSEVTSELEAIFPKKLSSDRLTRSREECGACLLDITEDDGFSESYQSELEELEIVEPNSFGLLDTCSHAFHSQCIKKWAVRETSCPLCKMRFAHIAHYLLNGCRMQIDHCPRTTFAETLTDSEAEEESEDASPIVLVRTRRTQAKARTRRPAARNPHRSRQRQTSELTLPQATPEDTQRNELRKSLRRQMELDRRRRASRKLTAEQAKKSIEAALARMPYQSFTPLSNSTIQAVASDSISSESANITFNRLREAAVEKRGVEKMGVEAESGTAIGLLGNPATQVAGVSQIDTESLTSAPLRVSRLFRPTVPLRSKARVDTLSNAFGSFAVAAPKYTADFLVKEPVKENFHKL